MHLVHSQVSQDRGCMRPLGTRVRDHIVSVARGRAGYHEPKGWRLLLVVTLFLLAWAAVAIVVGLRAFAVITSFGASLVAFTSGYLYRQQVLDRHRLPW